MLSRQGVLSVLAVPVFVAADWWGYLQFDACARERAWSALELDAVKAVVGMLEVTGRLQESLEGNAVRV